MSVLVALMVLSPVLSAGVWGRVATMWIAREMNKLSEPILHGMVPTRQCPRVRGGVHGGNPEDTRPYRGD